MYWVIINSISYQEWIQDVNRQRRMLGGTCMCNVGVAGHLPV